MEPKHFFNLPVIRALTDYDRLILVQIILRLYQNSGCIGNGYQAKSDTIAICGALSLRRGSKHIVRSEPYYGPKLNWSKDQNLEPGMPEECQADIIEWELPITKQNSQMLQLLSKIKNCQHYDMVDSLLDLEANLFFDNPEQFELLKRIML